MELFSYILICLILIWLSSNSLQEAAEFQLQDLNATTLFGQCIHYSDFFVCCQWKIRTKITRGDADILIPCEWPSWDSNTGIVDICTAGEEPDIPQALGALLGIWVLFRALEVGVWSVARAGPLHVFGLWPALVVLIVHVARQGTLFGSPRQSRSQNSCVTCIAIKQEKMSRLSLQITSSVNLDENLIFVPTLIIFFFKLAKKSENTLKNYELMCSI